MRKFKRQIENIDKFIASLEEMIDARDDMWEEEQHHNYKKQMSIEEERYLPAKAKLRAALHDFIVEVLEDESEDEQAA
jgi:hypothetical protein